MRKFLIMVVATQMLLACSPLPNIQSPPPTQIPGFIETTIVETSAAAQTRTAIVATPIPPTETAIKPPTLAATPTQTLFPTPTTPIIIPSATQILIPTLEQVVLPTQTLSEDVEPSKTPPPNEHDYSGTLACKSIGKTPVNGTVFSRRQKFTTVWTVKNTGTAAWKKGWIDYRYVGGDKFTDRERFNLNWILDPGETIDIKIDMFAPKKPGNYETTWTVGLNKGGLCKMTLAIVVK